MGVQVDYDPAEILGVLLRPVIEGSDLLSLEELQNALLQLATALTPDDLQQSNVLVDRLVEDVAQCAIDIAATVVDIVKVKGPLQGLWSTPEYHRVMTTRRARWSLHDGQIDHPRERSSARVQRRCNDSR